MILGLGLLPFILTEIPSRGNSPHRFCTKFVRPKLTNFVIFDYRPVVVGQIEMMAYAQNKRFPAKLNKYEYPVFIDLKVGKPGLFGSGFDSEGQLKERSEGNQAQWQTALGEVLAAGS
jgi:hypothetical protein